MIDSENKCKKSFEERKYVVTEFPLFGSLFSIENVWNDAWEAAVTQCMIDREKENELTGD